MDRLVVAPDVVCHEEAGEAFLLHVGSGNYYGLNESGLAVWKALAAGADPVAALHDRWPATPLERCRSDCERVVEGLRQAGLVVATGQPG